MKLVVARASEATKLVQAVVVQSATMKPKKRPYRRPPASDAQM